MIIFFSFYHLDVFNVQELNNEWIKWLNINAIDMIWSNRDRGKDERTSVDVAPVDGDVIVTIGSTLLVKESGGVHQLVNDEVDVHAPAV